MTSQSTIPVTVLTGYSGAGKTTFLNRTRVADDGWAGAMKPGGSA